MTVLHLPEQANQTSKFTNRMCQFEGVVTLLINFTSLMSYFSSIPSPNKWTTIESFHLVPVRIVHLCNCYNNSYFPKVQSQHSKTFKDGMFHLQPPERGRVGEREAQTDLYGWPVLTNISAPWHSGYLHKKSLCKAPYSKL